MSSIQVISAYLLAATAVESGNYSEDYEIDIDEDFADYMIEGDQEIVGDYIELSAPTGGSVDGNFSGNQFCTDWLSAFVRPIEYMTIYANRFSQSDAYPDPNNEDDWTSFVYGTTADSDMIPHALDDLVSENTSGKHINMWFASITLEPWENKRLHLSGVYIPSNVGFQLTSNDPTHGYGVFRLSNNTGNIYIPNLGYNYNYTGKRYEASGFVLNSQQSGQAGTFILVYNPDVFLSYLETCDRSFFQGISGAMFALAECNIKKEKHQTSGVTDWSDNDDYHGE